MKRIQLTYYAAFREQRGLPEEELLTDSPTLASLYEEMKARHGFSIEPSLVRFASNGVFAAADRAVEEGDLIVFVPPVAGG